MKRKDLSKKKDKAKSKKTRRIVWIVIAALLLVSFTAWKIARETETASCTLWEKPATSAYTEQEKVFRSMSLSYLVYGLEMTDGITEDYGCTISEILDRETIGIFPENYENCSGDETDPTTARIDTAQFINQQVGDFRLVTDLKDDRSGFYGVVFADDTNHVMWICYSGAATANDNWQYVQMLAGPRLSEQEQCAFSIYEQALMTEEIQNEDYNLILSGHSLGGGLATIVSCVSGCEACTISGSNGIALDKINDIADGQLTSNQVSNYMTSPDNGKVTMRDFIQRIMFLGSYDKVDCHIYADNGYCENAHHVFAFIQFEDGDLNRPVLPSEEVDVK